MAMDKKSLESRKTAPATKSKSTKKVDVTKPDATRIIAPRMRQKV